MTHKALVISDVWASVITKIAVAIIIGGGGYLWVQNANAARLQEKIQTLEDANLPHRITQMEAELKHVVKTTEKIEAHLEKIADRMAKK